MLELAQPLKGGSAGITEQKAFLARQFPCGERSVAVGNFFKLVNEAKVDVLRQNVFANTFGDVAINFFLVKFAGLVELFENRTVGIDAPNLDAWILLLEELCYAGYGSARAHAHHKVGDAALGLLPDLGTRGLVVRLAVAQIIVLIREE